MRREIICIDIDETLTKETCWTEEECLNALPNKEVIEKVNEIYNNNFVVIYTARRDFLIPATLKWLRKNGIMFHCISNNKIPTDAGYVDDKSVEIKNFLRR